MLSKRGGDRVARAAAAVLVAALAVTAPAAALAVDIDVPDVNIEGPEGKLGHPAYVDVEVVWSDDSNAQGERPDQVVVDVVTAPEDWDGVDESQLSRNELILESADQDADDANVWRQTWGIPVDHTVIEVAERDVDGYTVADAAAELTTEFSVRVRLGADGLPAENSNNAITDVATRALLADDDKESTAAFVVLEKNGARLVWFQGDQTPEERQQLLSLLAEAGLPVGGVSPDTDVINGDTSFFGGTLRFTASLSDRRPARHADDGAIVFIEDGSDWRGANIYSGGYSIERMVWAYKATNSLPVAEPAPQSEPQPEPEPQPAPSPAPVASAPANATLPATGDAASAAGILALAGTGLAALGIRRRK